MSACTATCDTAPPEPPRPTLPPRPVWPEPEPAPALMTNDELRATIPRPSAALLAELETAFSFDERIRVWPNVWHARWSIRWDNGPAAWKVHEFLHQADPTHAVHWQVSRRCAGKMIRLAIAHHYCAGNLDPTHADQMRDMFHSIVWSLDADGHHEVEYQLARQLPVYSRNDHRSLMRPEGLLAHFPVIAESERLLRARWEHLPGHHRRQTELVDELVGAGLGTL